MKIHPVPDGIYVFNRSADKSLQNDLFDFPAIISAGMPRQGHLGVIGRSEESALLRSKPM
jgi:hypothetical protein